MTSTGRKTTGRKTTGWLFKRGGKWWAAWMAHGVLNRRSTGIDVAKGQAGRDAKASAKTMLDEWVSPYLAGDVADVRAALVERQRDAQEVADERMARVVAEQSRIPLDEAWERNPYTTSQQTRGRTKVHPLSERNIIENKGAWEKFVRWVKGAHGEGLAMQDVTPEWAREYSLFLQGEGLTPQRHNKLITTAGVMYRLAGLESPFAAVDKLREAEAEHREPFTKEQVVKLLEAAEGEWRGFLAVLYFTGLRRGDAALLKHENRNRTTGKIRVVTAKTGEVVEPVEHPMLTAILNATAAPGKKGYLFPQLAARYQSNPNGISDTFRKFAAQALGELEVDEDGETAFRSFESRRDRTGSGQRKISLYGLHSFRHSFASHAAQAGIPLGRIQAWLGHSSAEITRIYTHYGDTAEQARVMEAVALPLAGAEPPPALPAHDPVRDALAAIVEAVGGMNARNWRAVRSRVLELAAKAERGEE